MKKLIILFCLVNFCLVSFGQVYQEMPQYGYRANRMTFDSTLSIPTTCGVPTLKSNITKKAALAFDSCNNKFYYYNPKTLVWSEVTGGGGTSPNLQQVLDIGNTAIDKPIILQNSFDPNTIYTKIEASGNGNADNKALEYNVGTPADGYYGNISLGIDYTLGIKPYIQGVTYPNNYPFRLTGDSLTFDNNQSSGNYLILSTNNQVKLALPTTIQERYLTASVNGNYADINGDITISTGDVAVDTIFRTSGKDSIYYVKNGNTYAIKDSVGTNPAPLGYYGAFQDTITQNIPTANTAYPIKARITDLSNGVILKDSTRFLFNNTGIYNLQWSGQFQNTDNAIQDVRVWVRKNNVDIIGTTGLVSIPARKNTSDYGHTVAGWNFLLDMVAGDSLQFYWSATSSSISLQYYPLGTIPPSPTTASMVVTITQQSGIMAGTGITAINSLTGAAQTMVVGTDSSDFKIVSSGTAHKFNLPTASSTKRGALSSTDWSTFNSKIGAADTSVFQRKSISSYSIMANNTNAAANTTAMTFRDVAEAAYTGNIVWTGTSAPTGITSRYRWSQIGNCVNYYICFSGSLAGTSITAITFDFPTDMPTPTAPSGLSGASIFIYKNLGYASTTSTSTTHFAASGGIRRNSANTAFEFIYSGYNSNIRVFQVTGTYYTN